MNIIDTGNSKLLPGRVIPAIFLSVFLLFSNASAGVYFNGTPGTSAPPATLGIYAMSQFAADARPVFDMVGGVPSPLGGNVLFSPQCMHMRIGNGWASWSHGYGGDVYWSVEDTAITITMPANTGAFFFYAQPDPFGTFNMYAVADDGTNSGSIPVSGSGGARYFGFYASFGATLVSIRITCHYDFAIGEFGIAERLVGPASYRSVASGNWSRPSTWESSTDGGITWFPAASTPGTHALDEALVRAGNTVTMDATAAIHQLTVTGAGATLAFDATGTPRTFEITGNVTIGAGGFLRTASSGTSTVHLMRIGGDVLVHGACNMRYAVAAGSCTVVFNGTADQHLDGAGTACSFHNVILQKGSVACRLIVSRTVSIGAASIGFAAGAWEQTAGTLIHNTNQNIPSAGAMVFSGSGGLSKQNTSLSVSGSLVVNTTGDIQIGSLLGDKFLTVFSAGNLTLHRGNISIGGQLRLLDNSVTTIDGDVTLTLTPQKGVTSIPPSAHVFETGGNAALSWTRGRIIIVHPILLSGTGHEVHLAGAGPVTVAGEATLQFGDGAVSTISGGDGFELYTGVNRSLHNMIVATGSADPRRCVNLVSDVTADGVVSVQSGGMITTGSSGSHTLNLDGASSLYEAPGRTVIGAVRVTRAVAGYGTFSFGNIGIELTGSANGSGDVTVTRVTNTAFGGSGASIRRAYQFSAAGNLGVSGSATFHYDGNAYELNGNTEGMLALHASVNGGSSWAFLGGAIDMGAKTIQASGMFSCNDRWLTASSLPALKENSREIAPVSIPVACRMGQNYPNPFTGTTNVEIFIPEESRVSVTVYDESGRRVAMLLNETVSAGSRTLQFNAAGLPAGSYLCRLETPNGVQTRWMTLAR